MRSPKLLPGDQQALALKEALLRINNHVTGHRLLRGALEIGGARVRQLPDTNELHRIKDVVDDIAAIALSQSVVSDRFTDTGILTACDTETVNALGPVARASGIATDVRLDHPNLDLSAHIHQFDKPTGDVLARFRIRVSEVADSVSIIDALANDVSTSQSNSAAPTFNATDAPEGEHSSGSGMVEGWRGTITHRIELDPAGRLSRVKIVDPSFFNWPALPQALAGVIVPDFPLVNKSFNLSYAGNDL